MFKFQPYMLYPSLQVPWMISLGNHDHDGGDVQPQVDYTELDPFWTLPTRYFKFNMVRGSIVGSQRGLVELDY